MTDNEFDDIFKKRLREYEGDIPADMWQRINTGKKKRRGGYIWIYLAAVLMLVIFTTGIYRFYTGTNKKDSNNHIITDTKNKTNSVNKADTVISTNETGSSFNNDIAGLTPPSKKINTVEKYYRQQPVKKQNDGNNNDLSSSKNMGDDLVATDRSNPEILDHNITDTTKMATQKKPANEEITAEESDDDSTAQNEEYDKLAIQLFVSPDIPFSTIRSFNKDYEKFLNDNISMKLSYTIGAAISFAVNKRIALSAGIQYSRVNETVSGIDSLTSTYKRSNHLSFINMPLTVSYKTKWTKAFQTSIKAGILLNVSSSYKGSMPDASGNFTDISQNIYESNTATSIYTAVNFSKSVTKDLDVFAEPYFRWQTKNMVNDMQPFTRKINTAGLALGIQWRLYKDEDK